MLPIIQFVGSGHTSRSAHPGNTNTAPTFRAQTLGRPPDSGATGSSQVHIKVINSSYTILKKWYTQCFFLLYLNYTTLL